MPAAADPTLEADAGAPAPPTGPPSGDPANDNPAAGGGPVLAGLMRQRAQPPMSAPGPGNAAMSMVQLKSAVDLLNKALPGLMGTPAYTAVLNALRQMSKHLQAGQPAAGVQQTMLQDLLRGTAQNALFQKLLGQKGAQGQEQNQNMPAGQAPNMTAQPMPSTPLPGA